MVSPSLLSEFQAAGPNPSVNLPYEAQLILACSRTEVLPGQRQHIARLLNETLDWDAVLAVAQRNGVLSLLSKTLTEQFIDSVPDEIGSKLTTFLKEHTKWNLFLTSELVRVMKLFETNGLQVLPFKGPTLAIQAYGNLMFRQYIDLDVLVKPKDFERAILLLNQTGYSSKDKANWLKRKAQFFTQRMDIALLSEDGRVRVELHWKLSGSHFSLPLQMAQFWDRLEQLHFGGITVRAMPLKDLFVYLSLHAARHEWERLGWLVDLNELIDTIEGRGQRINWDEIRQHASEHGCERVIELALLLLEEFYEKKMDFPIFERSDDHGGFDKIIGDIRTRMFSPYPTRSTKEEKKTYLIRLQEKPIHRIRLYAVYITSYFRILFMPNALDRAIVRLPPVLYPLYFILRPFRLVFNYFSGNSIQKNEN